MTGTLRIRTAYTVFHFGVVQGGQARRYGTEAVAETGAGKEGTGSHGETKQRRRTESAGPATPARGRAPLSVPPRLGVIPWPPWPLLCGRARQADDDRPSRGAGDPGWSQASLRMVRSAVTYTGVKEARSSF